MKDPAFLKDLEAARQELAAAKGKSAGKECF
jgi:hypothetical protein